MKRGKTIGKGGISCEHPGGGWMARNNPKYIWAIKFSVLGIAILLYFILPGFQDFIHTGMRFLQNRNFDGLRAFILSYGVWAPLTSIALMTMQSVLPLVPGIVITIANAWIFGWQYGALYSWLGALAGAVLDFGIARWFGRPVIERLVPKTLLDTADRFCRRNAVFAVLFTRLTPFIPFKVISYGAGLTSMSLPQFVLATGIGQTLPIILYSYLCLQLARNMRWTIGVTLLLLVLAFGVYYFRNNIESAFFTAKNRRN